MIGIDAYAALQNIPDDMVEEARLPQDGGAAVVNPKQERRETARRLLSSPAFAVAVSLAAAFIIVIAIVRAGGPGGRTDSGPAPVRERIGNSAGNRYRNRDGASRNLCGNRDGTVWNRCGNRFGNRDGGRNRTAYLLL